MIRSPCVNSTYSGMFVVVYKLRYWAKLEYIHFILASMTALKPRPPSYTVWRGTPPAQSTHAQCAGSCILAVLPVNVSRGQNIVEEQIWWEVVKYTSCSKVELSDHWPVNRHRRLSGRIRPGRGEWLTIFNLLFLLHSLNVLNSNPKLQVVFLAFPGVVERLSRYLESIWRGSPRAAEDLSYTLGYTETQSVAVWNKV